MELNDYQQRAFVTAVYEGKGRGEWAQLAYTALGAAGEAGEIANKVKKINRDSNMEVTSERRQQILDEIGGTLWYLAAVCTELRATLDEVAEQNLEHLAGRVQRGTIWGDGDVR